MSVLTRVVLVTAPATLSAQVIGPTRIDLSWPAVLGAASYRVYRGGVLVDSPSGLTSSSTGLTPSTLYSFRVSSVGEDGQEGPQGNQVSANTTAAADTTAPTAPVLGIPTQSGSNSLIVPMTTASSDVSGIASYSLERATAAIGPFSVINSVALFPYTDLGLSAATTYWYRARATDNASNVGAYSNIVSQSTIAQSSTIQFTPGHYMNVDVGSGGGGLSGWISQINSIANEPTIKGVKIALNWDDIEPTTQGVYSFTILDQIVNACAAINKKLMVIVECQYFSTSVTNPAGRLPTYVINNGWYYQWDGTGTPAGNLALAVRLDLTACMNRFIAMGQACAARYNTGGTVEQWMIGETAMDIPSSTGWSQANWFARVKDWGREMRLAWTQTGVRIYANYLNSDAQMQELMDHCLTHKITVGGPDNYSRIYQSNPIYTGHVGGIDYRNRMPWASENQRPATSSGGSTATTAQIYAHNESGALADGGSTKPNYYVWYKPYLGETWSGQVLPFIRSINGACNTTNPYLSFDFYISPTGSDSNAGTQSAPWAITALNTKSQIAGKRVGLLDGTYDLSGITQPGSSGDTNVFNVPSGSAGAPTVIAAVNARAAIIKGNNGSSYPFNNVGLIGNTSNAGYVTVDGLKFTGANMACMVLGNSGNQGTSQRSPGYVIKNCEFTGLSQLSGWSGGNGGPLKTYATSGMLVQKCWFHDNVSHDGAGSNDHISDVLCFACEGLIVEYCSLERSGGIYGKWTETVDVEIRYCYLDFAGYNGETRAIADFNTAESGADGYIKVHHNVIIAPQCDLRPTSSQLAGGTSNLQWYNNTQVYTSQGLIGTVPAGTANVYNNIVTGTVSGDVAFITINLNANGLIDFNMYYNPTEVKWGSYASNSQSGGRTTYSSFTAWKSAMGNNTSGTGCDANSISGSDPLFLMSGSKANRYQLHTTLSLAKGAGRSDGTVSGSACDMGAWGGASPPSRIGCDF